MALFEQDYLYKEDNFRLHGVHKGDTEAVQAGRNNLNGNLLGVLERHSKPTVCQEI